MKLSSFLSHHKSRSFFLPAHSRGQALPNDLKELLRKRPGIWDIPEIPNFGGPLLNYGAVAESQLACASEFGVERAWYGVNGATGLLQAALLAIAEPGSAILMPRNVHQSIIQGCVLADLKPILFGLPFLADRCHFLPPDKKWLSKVLDEVSLKGIQIKGALLVNPSYHGYAEDIVPLVNLLHERDLPVIVDEAHGFHFSIGAGELPNSGLKAGADLVVHSLHKSAPGLNQTAVLWNQGNRVDPSLVERCISLLQTTSPSSLLLASCESSLLEFHGPRGKRKLVASIEKANKISQKLRNNDLPLLATQDPFRLILHTSALGINGFDAYKWLISKGIIAELPEPGTLTFCMGFAPDFSKANFLIREWNKLINYGFDRESLQPFSAPSFPLITEMKMPCFAAWRNESKEINIRDALGKIAAEIICPYPPGIPIVIPGELLDANHIAWILEQKSLWPEQIPSKIRIVS